MDRQESRKYNKQVIVNSCGGKCQICGYNKCLSALAFHHRDPTAKDFNISKYSSNKNIGYEVLYELEKCILLCHNCHAEVHEGMHKKELKEIPEIELVKSVLDYE